MKRLFSILGLLLHRKPAKLRETEFLGYEAYSLRTAARVKIAAVSGASELHRRKAT